MVWISPSATVTRNRSSSTTSSISQSRLALDGHGLIIVLGVQNVHCRRRARRKRGPGWNLSIVDHVDGQVQLVVLLVVVLRGLSEVGVDDGDVDPLVDVVHIDLGEHTVAGLAHGIVVAADKVLLGEVSSHAVSTQNAAGLSRRPRRW